MTEKFGGDIGRKYSNIDRGGRKALVNAEFKEFDYSHEEMKRRFNVSAQFEPSSAEEFGRRITTVLEKNETDFGIKLLLAGRDFPLHTTLLEGRDESVISDDDREAIFSQVAPQAQSKTTSVVGQEIEFKYLLVDKGNLILTSVDIPETVLHLRSGLAPVYSTGGLRPLPMTNILHITVGRIVKMPTAEKTDALKRYKDEMIKLRHDISSSPLRMKIGEIYTGSAYDFLIKNSQ